MPNDLQNMLIWDSNPVQSFEKAFEQQWQRISQSLNDMDDQRQVTPEINRFDLGVDIAVLGGMSSSQYDVGSGLSGGLSLAVDNTKLNLFSGLREGARQLMR